MKPTRYEYRVTWRRPWWSERTSSKSRLFRHLSGARRFAGQLAQADTSILRIDQRPVGTWEPTE
jgi:hypothetical protein